MYPEANKITTDDLPAVRAAIVRQFQPLFNAMTDRQREVLELVAHGLSADETANALGTSMASLVQRRGMMMSALHLGTTRSDLAVALAAYWCCRYEESK